MGDITLDHIIRLYKQNKIDKKTAQKLIDNKSYNLQGVKKRHEVLEKISNQWDDIKDLIERINGNEK